MSECYTHSQLREMMNKKFITHTPVDNNIKPDKFHREWH